MSQARNDTIWCDGQSPANPSYEVCDARKDIEPLGIGQTQLLSQTFSGDVSPITAHVPRITVEGRNDEHCEPNNFTHTPMAIQLDIITDGSKANGTERGEVLAAIDKLPFILSINIPSNTFLHPVIVGNAGQNMSSECVSRVSH